MSASYLQTKAATTKKAAASAPKKKPESSDSSSESDSDEEVVSILYLQTPCSIHVYLMPKKYLSSNPLTCSK